MLVLIGTKEGFAISEKWILERTGLLHASYINARDALVKRGWLHHEKSKGIVVDIKAIYAENRSNTTLPQESNTTLPQRSNTILPQSGNTTLPITYNKNNNINNKTGESETQSVSPSVEEPVEKEVEGIIYSNELVDGMYKYINDNIIQTITGKVLEVVERGESPKHYKCQIPEKIKNIINF